MFFFRLYLYLSKSKEGEVLLIEGVDLVVVVY